MSRRKGSITAYLSLILLVILSLFLQCLYSVRISNARELTACAAQQGLFSLVATYDRTLLKEYELLFLDSGYGTGTYRTDLMEQTIRTYANEMLRPAGKSLLPVSNLSSGSATEVTFTAISLASDYAGTAFQRQVLEAMKANLGSAGVQLLLQKIRGGNSAAKPQESLEHQRHAIQDYEHAKEAAEETIPEQKPEEESGKPVDVPENFKNPIEVLSEMMKKGILALILPEDQRIPGGVVNPDELLSHRKLQTGFGSIQEENHTDFVDKSLLCAYGLWKFPSYSQYRDEPGLNLQLEYLLEGKQSDVDNLSAVLTKLLLMREGVNLAYLWSDPQKVSEMTAMSEIIAASLALPVALPIVTHALAVCWAFAESVAELRALLSGDKVPLLPSSSGWRVSLESLADFTGQGQHTVSSGGLSYQEYLAILLEGTKTETLTLRMMDLVEYNMRNRFGKSEFRLDLCVDQIEITMQTYFPGTGNYRISRSYGYKEQI